MKLADTETHWNAFGQKDPFWAVLSHPEKKGGGWDKEEFFQTGLDTVAEVQGWLAKAGLALPKGVALDFGCGVGRLTQALALHFETVHGVDIASSMIALANDYNRFGERCVYHHNNRPDLSLFADSSFDFVLSLITLQHLDPIDSLRYVEEFVRVLKPGGVLVFQQSEPPLRPERPAESLSAKRRVTNALHRVCPPLLFETTRLVYWRLRLKAGLAEAIPSYVQGGEPEPVMEMNGVPHEFLASFLSRLPQVRLRVCEADSWAGWMGSWHYIVTKDA